ncbi:MAG TPA: GMC family oxidoreductase N-terminal domain-containing protein, partial [Myxococcota bacterium]|nr:GMC family oxidoreductase N-terminal domain-containing protein [Myxococcota bacterium]
MDTVDVVVVGGGSSGCVVAAGVAADPSLEVALLERGPSAEAHPETLRADGYKDAFRNDALIWERFTAPQRSVRRRELFAGTGSVLGGSGSVNGMVYTRGSRLDYDAWPAGWRWDDVAPAFDALEATLRPHRRAPTAWTEAVLA